MRSVLCGVLLSVASMLLSARAQSPFDGTWRLEMGKTQPSNQHYDYLLKDGMYHCTTCDPVIEVRADGQDHKVMGDSCYDTVSVKVVDDRTTVETEKRKSRIVSTFALTVSADGKTSTADWAESCNAKGEVVAERAIMSRIAEAPPGAHAISGSWKVSKRLTESENAVLITLKLDATTFSFSDPTDQHYRARLDGTETAFEGDLNGSVVSVKRISENTIMETDRQQGRVTRIAHFQISGDGTTLTVTEENPAQATSRKFIAHKQ